jgi:ribosome-binding protein aMBF1 (putative translation factor)
MARNSACPVVAAGPAGHDRSVGEDQGVPESNRGPEHVALGAAIRAVREERGLSLTDLAKAAETDKAYLSGLERGMRNPSWAFIVRLAKMLDISPTELVGRSERL